LDISDKIIFSDNSNLIHAISLALFVSIFRKIRINNCKKKKKEEKEKRTKTKKTKSN